MSRLNVKGHRPSHSNFPPVRTAHVDRRLPDTTGMMYKCHGIAVLMRAEPTTSSPSTPICVKPILTHPEVRSALREAIEHVRESLPFTIDAWILLPDHLHAIWTLPQSDAAYG